MTNKIKNNGFTLIETLVAVLLLSLAIAGPLSIASKGLSATLVAKDQFIAFYLAQDAMEFVRSARDSNSLSGGDWLAGSTDLTTHCISTDGLTKACRIDSIQGTVTPCGNAQCNLSTPVASSDVLYYDAMNHYFTYSHSATTITPQKFFRRVAIKYDSSVNPDEAVVTVTVSWTDIAGVTHKPITVREIIFRWQ